MTTDNNVPWPLPSADDGFPLRLLREHQFAVIDQVAVPSPPSDWPLTPLVPQLLEREGQAKLLPCLLPLSAFTIEKLGDLLQQLATAHQHQEALPIVTLLKSAADLEAMRLHWTNQLLINLPEGKKALLRSYDPRVFMQLQWMLTPEQLCRLYGPIETWTVYYQQRWQSFPCSPVEPDYMSGCTPRQARSLGHIGLINQVLSKLAESATANHARIISLSQEIDVLLNTAEDQGLRRDDERVLFALHGMRYGKNFFKHERMAEMLRTYDRNEQTYCDATYMLSAQEWADIAGKPAAQ